MRRTAIALAAALVLTSCGGDAPAPRRGGRPPQVRVIARNLLVLAGEARAMRFGFEPAEDAATLIVSYRPEDARISVCALRALDAVPDDTACRADIRSGVAEPFTTSGLRALAVVLETGVAEVDAVLTYDEGGRALAMRLPALRAPSECDDAACLPFVEMRPTRAGRLTARARWRGADASLVVLQGHVLGRASSATGFPYREPARSSGRSPLSVEADLTARDEYALAFEPQARATVRDVEIDARWP